jgi:hypothetical protein
MLPRNGGMVTRFKFTRILHVPLVLTCVVVALAAAVRLEPVDAQGWRGRGAHAFAVPRGRWGGQPGFQRGPFGPRFARPGFLGPRPYGQGSSGQRPFAQGSFAQGSFAQRSFGQRPFAQRSFASRFTGLHYFGSRYLGARGGPQRGFAAFQRRPVPGEVGFTGVPPVGETRFRSHEMVFHADPNVSPQTIANAAHRLGLSTIDQENLSLTGGTLIHFHVADGRDMSDVIRQLEAEKIGIAQPNYVFKLQQQRPNLAALTTLGNPHQYVVDKLRLAEVHRISIGSNVPVAVIDSEIDLKHPDLAGAFTGAFEATGRPEKPHTHGTGMAGAIAAHRTLTGVAPGAHILAVHAFSSDAANAEATTDHIIRGIEWAINKGARIINMSFAGPDDPMLEVALKKAREKGVILIAAAGNSGPDSPPLYPGADPNVIAVTATDERDALFAEANRGSYVALAAPGVDVLEPAPGGGYQVTTGTSVAAAHVSGVAALLLERNPKLDANAVREILESSAKDLGAKGRDNDFGWGLVDPYRALQAVDARGGPMASEPLDSQRASTKSAPPSTH